MSIMLADRPHYETVVKILPSLTELLIIAATASAMTLYAVFFTSYKLK